MTDDLTTHDFADLPPAERAALEREARMIATAPSLSFDAASCDIKGKAAAETTPCDDISD